MYEELMMYEELVKRLREAPRDWPDADLHYDAADAIESLTAMVQHYKDEEYSTRRRIEMHHEWGYP